MSCHISAIYRIRSLSTASALALDVTGLLCTAMSVRPSVCFFRGERCGFPIANILSFYQTKEYEAAVMFAVKWEVVRSSNERSACFLLTHIDKRNDRSMMFDSINITRVRNKNMENTLFILLLVCKEIFSVFSEMKEDENTCVFGWMSESEFKSSASQCKRPTFTWNFILYLVTCDFYRLNLFMSTRRPVTWFGLELASHLLLFNGISFYLAHPNGNIIADDL